MPWLLSIFVGIITSIITGGVSLFMADLATRWHEVSDREGGRGFAVIFFGLLGLLGGLIVGIAGTRLTGGPGASGFFKGLGGAIGIALVLVAVASGVAYITAEHAPTIAGQALELEVEVRCPEGTTPPITANPGDSTIQVYATDRKTSRIGQLDWPHAQQVDGRWIVRGRAELHTSGDKRLLRILVSPLPEEYHMLPLAGRPGRSDMEWSDWLPRKRPDGTGGPSEKILFAYRYRVQPESPPAAAQEVTSDPDDDHSDPLLTTRAYKALRPETPLAYWIPHASYRAPEGRKPEALRAIAARPELVKELAELIRANDPEVATLALRLIEDLPTVAPEWAAPVQEVGARILRDLEKFNASKPADDPSYQAAADISVWYSAWLAALRGLHDKAGVDTRPQLQAVLELAKVRTDSQVLQSDVVRTATYYVDKWNTLRP